MFAYITRKYQSCYYEISGNLDDAKLKSLAQQGTRKIELHLKITKLKNMNVYVYGGESRFDAKMPIIPDNKPATVGVPYKVDQQKDKGMLLVAYPN